MLGGRTLAQGVGGLQGEVAVGEVVCRSGLLALGRLSLLLQLHVAEDRDQHEEHDDAHAATHDEAEAARQDRAPAAVQVLQPLVTF